MNDRVLRQTERLRDGNPITESAYLIARLRSGTLTTDKVSLMAYCGDEAARVINGPLPWEANVNPALNHWSLRDWTYHLWDRSRCWPGEVLLRASVAAAEAVWQAGEETCDCYGYHDGQVWDPHPNSHHDGTDGSASDAQRAAISAIRSWLACPCEDHKQAWFSAIPAEDTEFGGVFTKPWLPIPNDSPRTLKMRVLAAVYQSDEDTVRTAIQTDLVRWCLGG